MGWDGGGGHQLINNVGGGERCCCAVLEKKKKGGVSLVTQRNTNMVTISNAISFGLLGSRPFGLQASTGTLLVVGGMGDLLAMV